ncbi:MAG TPA: DDE-type integrase/transposase/recombinase [Nitrosopumilaceae archaeon]|nr:DDE-type integrase/transposase/recombinase [Nitrosopumilaceae archaeon]
MKALTIVGQNDQIKRINAVTYKVKSQNSDFWYDVKHPYKSDGNWICSCPDHEFRKVECKHIKSVLISKQLRKIIPNSEVNEIEIEKEIICKCGSLDVIKTGIRHNKSGNIQRFRCKKCNAKWSDNLGFAKNKVSSKIITASLDLFFKGVALRKIKEHVKFFYGVNVSHVAILGWIRKFEKVVNPFVDSLVPKEMSGVYHVDEMAVHVRKEQTDKGHYQWLWNMMDNTTRFWISSKVSQRREVSDARAVFQDAKTKSPKPIAIVHDGLHSYNEAFEKEYHTMQSPRTRNIRSVSVRHKGLNQKVERLNGVFRDREKVMRGMDHKESAQKTIDAFRIHYNFIREHGSIKKTPAEQAGIKLDLGQNRIENLIKLASKNN